MRISLIVISSFLSFATYADGPIPRPLTAALAQALQAKVNAACSCSVIGVAGSFRKYPDKSDWRIDWRGGETDAQKLAGQAALKSFNINDPANRGGM